MTRTEVKQPWPLESVYDKEKRPQAYPKFTFHNNHYDPESHYNDILDFIYHSPLSLPLLASLSVFSSGQRGRDELACIEQTSLPNELIPSDHMPLGATFYLPTMDRERERDREREDAQQQQQGKDGEKR